MTDDVWPSRLRGQHPVNPDTEDMFLEMMRPPDRPQRFPHPETEAADMVDPADLFRDPDEDLLPGFVPEEYYSPYRDTTIDEPVCTGCGRRPADIDVYVQMAADEGITPDEYVRREEGTLNPRNGHFLCNEDYIKAGMPSGPNGWVAP